MDALWIKANNTIPYSVIDLLYYYLVLIVANMILKSFTQENRLEAVMDFRWYERRKPESEDYERFQEASQSHEPNGESVPPNV